MSELTEKIRAQRLLILLQSDDPQEVNEAMDLMHEAAEKLEAAENMCAELMSAPNKTRADTRMVTVARSVYALLTETSSLAMLGAAASTKQSSPASEAK